MRERIHRIRPCAIVYKASWAEQQCIKTTIKELEQKAREAGITKTALVLVGDFLGEQYAFFQAV